MALNSFSLLFAAEVKVTNNDKSFIDPREDPWAIIDQRDSSSEMEEGREGAPVGFEPG